VTEELPSG